MKPEIWGPHGYFYIQLHLIILIILQKKLKKNIKGFNLTRYSSV